MTGVLIFAGTADGRRLAEQLGGAGVRVHTCVATAYGGEMMGDGADVSVGGMDADRMGRLMADHPLVVDATHPYATRITVRIREACERAGAEYIRLLRPGTPAAGVVAVDSVDAAVAYLEGTTGPVLVTTGSKEIDKYAKLGERVHARVLPSADSIGKCVAAGLPRRNIIAMQGPFDEEFNYGLLRQIGARYMVTKDSGAEGGTPAKLAAAAAAGVETVMVGRPLVEAGLSYEETLTLLAGRLGFAAGAAPQATKRRLTVVGIGMGDPAGMTGEARAAIAAADLVVGAERMVAAAGTGTPVLVEYAADRVMEFLDRNPGYRDIAFLVSGDVGFYSAADRMAAAAERKGFAVGRVCGIASLVHLCARAGVPWEDVRPVSLHGRRANAVGEVRRNRRTFFLLEGAGGARELAGLLERHCPAVTVTLGEDLGQAGERISVGAPAIAYQATSPLCVMLVENPHPRTGLRIGIPDAEFVRGGAPMTKAEVRALSLAKLELSDDAVVYDIGAGTGSVAVEAALTAVSGTVYAIERDPEAVGLIEANAERFGATNLVAVAGTAPEALVDLPPPTHVFVGGSAGRLESILAAAIDANPAVRIAINAVTLETLSEATACIGRLGLKDDETVCVNISTARKAGGYRLMTANNPVHIISCRGPGA